MVVECYFSNIHGSSPASWWQSGVLAIPVNVPLDHMIFFLSDVKMCCVLWIFPFYVFVFLYWCCVWLCVELLQLFSCCRSTRETFSHGSADTYCRIFYSLDIFSLGTCVFSLVLQPWHSHHKICTWLSWCHNVKGIFTIEKKMHFGNQLIDEACHLSVKMSTVEGDDSCNGLPYMFKK